jgi:hypothetical protein
LPDIPIQSIAILVGIDKFMSECRALTNLVGNGVACVVISLSEGELYEDKLHETMAHPIELGEALEPGAGEPAAPPSHCLKRFVRPHIVKTRRKRRDGDVSSFCGRIHRPVEQHDLLVGVGMKFSEISNECVEAENSDR